MTSTDRTPPSSEVTALPESLEGELFEIWMGEDRVAAERGLDDLCARHPKYASELRNVARRLDMASGECSRVVSEAAAPPPRPERIGPYRILDELGRGGFGIVWLAEQSEPLQRRVALKVLQAFGRNEKVLQRFEAERHTLAQMQHPGIANILDAGTTEDGEPYFVMEHVPGRPVTEYCDEHGLGIDERLELFLKICSAVQHAHQNGVIHRDLKPGNVLVHEQDEPIPKVIDFGLAKALQPHASEQRGITEEGRFVGTPEYMSPEQAAGEPVDTRTDVYALGVLLYELLTGQLPIPSEKLRSGGWSGTIRALREHEPLRPSEALERSSSGVAKMAARRGTASTELLRRVRGDLDWITRKALAKERDERYASVAELAADLQRHLQDLPVSVGPPSLGYVFRKFFRRHRAGVVATALIGIVAILAVVLIVAARFDAERRRLDAEYNAYAARIAVAKAALDMRRTGSLREALERTPAHLRGWEWRFLSARSDQSLRVLGAGDGRLHRPILVRGGALAIVARDSKEEVTIEAWDLASGELRYAVPAAHPEVFQTAAGPDGDTFAVAYTQPAAVHLHDAATGEPLVWTDGAVTRPMVFELAGSHASCAFDPSGRTISVGASDTIRVFDLATGAPRLEMHREGHVIQQLAYSLDGTLILSCGHNDGIAVWDAASGEHLRQLVASKTVKRGFDLDPRGTRVAVACTSDEVVRIFDITRGELVRTLRAARWVTDVAYSRDAATLVTTHLDGSMTYWDLENGSPLETCVGHTRFVDGVIFLPDDSGVVTAAWDGTLRTWPPTPPPVASRRVSEPDVTVLLAAVHPTRPLAFAAVGGSRLLAWNLDTGERLWLADGAPRATSFAVDAAGARLFAGDHAGRVSEWAVATGELRREVEVGSSRVEQLALSSKGDLLAANLYDAASRGTRIVVLETRTLEVVRESSETPKDDSPYGQYYVAFVTGGDGRERLLSLRHTIRATDPRTGRVLAETPLPATVRALSVAADQRTIAVGDVEGGLATYDGVTGERIRVLQRPTRERIFSASAFAPDLARLAACDEKNQAIRIFDPRRGTELLALYDHRAYCLGLAFGPRGDDLYVSNGPGKNAYQLRVWDARRD